MTPHNPVMLACAAEMPAIVATSRSGWVAKDEGVAYVNLDTIAEWQDAGLAGPDGQLTPRGREIGLSLAATYRAERQDGFRLRRW